MTGTELSDSYQSLVLLNYSGVGQMNGQWTQGVVPASNPNPDLKWETTKQFNAGLDLTFGRFQGCIGLLL